MVVLEDVLGPRLFLGTMGFSLHRAGSSEALGGQAATVSGRPDTIPHLIQLPASRSSRPRTRCSFLPTLVLGKPGLACPQDPGAPFGAAPEPIAHSCWTHSSQSGPSHTSDLKAHRPRRDLTILSLSTVTLSTSALMSAVPWGEAQERGPGTSLESV